MKHIIANHTCSAFLKPGEVIVTTGPILVSTVLGSCVAITMYSSKKKIGAICHAMLANVRGQAGNLLSVDSAVRYMYRKMKECGCCGDLEIKIFGGAQLLGANYGVGRKTVGEQNVMEAKHTISELGLQVSNADTGGSSGRKLFFSIMTGDVYLRKLKQTNNACGQG